MMNRRELMIGAASLPLASLAHARPLAATAAAPGTRRLQTFDYRGVRLLPSRLADQVQAARDRYLGISNDSILKGFRRDAGMSAPGEDLKGWSKRNAAQTFGQWLSGMARMSCATGDTDLRNKALLLTEEWGKTLGPDGNYRMTTYEWEKTCCGLVDMALYADDRGAFRLLERITQWATASLDRSRNPATPEDRDGRRPKGTLEWYTLAENSYRAYLATGNPLFRDFAALWLYPSYWDKFEDSSRPAGAELLHSYSHINTFSSAAMAYAVTGEARYLRILRNAYRYGTEVQAYASGGYGPGEWSVPADGTLGRALEWRSDSAEIPCGSWGAFKLSKYLLTFTGEAQYGEWMETLLYNGIGAALPVQPDGTTFYYADYRLGTATKLYYWSQWPCCSGTYIQTVADYHDILYLHDDHDLYVNLFVPSEVTWHRDGSVITVQQQTRYPEEGTVRFRVTADRPVTFALKLRAPRWVRSWKLSVAGEPIEAPPRAGQWTEVRRTWNPGDTLELAIDMPLYTVPVDPQHPRRAAVKYGPVLLAQNADYTSPFTLRPDEDIASVLRRPGQGPVFDIVHQAQPAQGLGRLQPFYAVEERSPYRVYFDLDTPRYL